MPAIRLKIIKPRPSNDKRYKERSSAAVSELQYGPMTAEEAHESMIEKGTIVPEQVPVGVKKTWWRRWLGL